MDRGVMAEKRTTAVQVAARSGVSQSAASRVFIHGASASKKTTAKVRQPANRMIDSTVEILLGQVEGDTSARRISIDGPLFPRGTARIPDGWNR